MEHSKKQSNTEFFSFIIAVCAVLISGASFYATYLQADAAEKQVKAMTLPIVQYSHGNYNREEKVRRLYFEFQNAGVGPALIKYSEFVYQDKAYSNLMQVLNACCESNLEKYREVLRSEAEEVGMITSSVNGVVIKGQDFHQFFSLEFSEHNKMLWNEFDKERHQVSTRVCYCSLLDDCYLSEQNGAVEEVQACPVWQPEKGSEQD